MNPFTQKIACTMVTLCIGRKIPLHILRSEWNELSEVEQEQTLRYAKAQKVEIKIEEDRR